MSEALLNILSASAPLLDPAAHVASVEKTSDPAGSLSNILTRLPHTIAQAIRTEQDLLHSDDVQLSLLILHSLHYGGLVDTDDNWEWHPILVSCRVALERVFERELRERVGEVSLPAPSAEAVATALFELTAPTPGPSAARYIEKHATHEQAREYLKLRSIYTLKEADAQTWAIPRLPGRAKAALVEIQADEYGGGRLERMHSQLFAQAMRGAGLSDVYGAYVDAVPTATLASFNMMTMFGLNRRLRGASAGHFAVYEMTSSLPNRKLADGFRRLGYGDNVADYFEEHVEADAVHEQIAGRDLAGGLVEAEPQLLTDVMFGAHAAMLVDGTWATETLDSWQAGQSALRPHSNSLGAAAGAGLT